MKAKSLGLFAMVSMALLMTTTRGLAQSTYSNAIMSLNPVGYWPMHEVEPAAPGDIETNYGTLGLLGTGFYPDWASATPSVKRGAPGAIVGDSSDTAVSFTRGGSPAGGTYTNTVLVPHNSPLATLTPPFSVECWFFPTNLTSEDIWAQCGDEGLNVGNAGGNVGVLAGIRLVWMDSTNTGFQIFNLDGSQFSAGFSGNVGGPQANPTNNWYHLVVTCDANTNFSLYVNGNQASLQNLATGNGPGTYAPDYWTPLTIGGGRGGSRACAGSIDEFAVYTNVISDVSTHYSDGISGAAGAYFHDVTNDDPVIYLRMDAPTTYTAPSASTWPALADYGTTNGVAVGNGIYTPGTLPGIVKTLIANPNGVPFGGDPNPVAALSGVGSFGDAGSAPVYNPTGSNATFTVTALFRGNPCDNRVQSIVGHGTNSWQLNVTTNGCIVFDAGNGNKAAGGTSQAAGDIRTTGVYNDGNWHQVVAVNNTNIVSIYVDGLLDTNGIPAGITVTNFIHGNANDVMIGSDPTYTNIPAGVGRSFAGQICDVAFFTNALTANQVQTLYSNCLVAPFITAQPPTGRALNGGPGTVINFGVTAKGSLSLAYQWYFNTSSNYTGATKLADNAIHYANSTTSQMTITNLAGGDSGYYYVVITNSYGSVTSILASLTVFGAPTLLTQFPIPLTNPFTLYSGTSPTFSIAANGAQPISYFWYTNGVLDTAATNSSFAWAGVPAGMITNYCILTNAAGSATSMVWTASVITTPTAPYPVRVLALNPVGYWRLNEPDDGNGNSDGNDGAICHDYAGGNDGIYTNMVLGQQGYSPTTDPTETAAYVGENNISFYDSLAEQIQGVDFGVTNGANGEFTVEAWANGYLGGQIVGAPLVAKGLYGVDDEFNLGIDSTKTHYEFYVRAANGTNYVVGSGSSSALDNNWHHIVGVCDEANGLLSLYYDGQLVNTAAIPTNSGVYKDSEPITMGAGGTDGINYTNQFYGYMDDVAIYNQALTASNVAVQYFSLGSKPSVAPPPPAATNVIGGGTLVIPAIGVGTPPSGYYWLDENANTNVAAGTTTGLFLNASLTVSNVPASWNGDTLELVLTNAYGTTSYAVVLSVNTNAPQVTLDLPSPVTVVSGRSYIYSVAADGIGPISYQWYNAGTLAASQTNTSYTVTAGSPGNTTYFVTISNVFGVVTSSVSTFTSIGTTPQPLTTGYETNLLLLKPVGYWPMHEVEAGAPGDIEVNYGTLGQLGAGFYPDWVTDYGGFVRQEPGALADDNDSALGLTFGTANAGTTVSFTNGLYVPHTSPLTTLNPPFSVECWFYPTNSPTGEAVWAQTGAVGLNGGALGSMVNYSGIMLNWANGTLVPYGFDEQSGGLTANNGAKLEGSQGDSGGTPVEPINHWIHVVVTCDANTNFNLYANGTLVAGPKADVGIYSPDYWTPISIGSGNGGLRSSAGIVDEFAVYTTNLLTADIATHYQDGVSGSAGAYVHDVLNDSPVVYLRMDAPRYSPPTTNFWPLLFNYGSAGGNGLYSPGTMPGIAAGPSTNAAGVPFGGLPVASVSQLSGVSSFADAGYTAAYNPTGATPFSVSVMFRGNPCDNRPQSIVSHSTNSWGIWMNTSGKLVCYLGTNSGSLTSSGVYNDGNWHQVVAVYAPSSNPNALGTGAIYVDGALDTSVSAVSANGIEPGSPLDVMIGSDPQLTNNPVGVGASFAGQICDVALFATALNAGQIAALYIATETNDIPAFFAPAPPASATVAPGAPLAITAGAAGTDPLYYQWQIITNGSTNVLVSGLTDGVPLNATLNIATVPAAWNGGQLELTVTNAYGTNVALVSLSVLNPVNASPTNIVFALTNNQLVLSWPADHTGWQLQAQTNSLAVGIGTNWVNVANSQNTNQLIIPINLTNGSVFYRLLYP